MSTYLRALAEAMDEAAGIVHDYAWIITKDHISDPGDDLNRVGTMGPRLATDEQMAKLKAGEGHPFRMYDDDGELYFEGRFLGDKEDEDAFGPLSDLGTPDAGCTEIRYKYGNEWRPL